MKTLISIVSVEEALEVKEGGGAIVDIKNVEEGSLGAHFPWVIRGIIAALDGRNMTFSATLGDLSYKPGTAALAALGASACGVQYVKAGLYGVRDYGEALEVMSAVVRTCKNENPRTRVVAAGYADYRRFGGIDTQTVVQVAHDSGADLVMVDTSIKDGKTLFDAMSMSELEDFIGEAHARGLEVALGGSVRFDHLDDLKRLGPDVVGVRGCVCAANDRTTKIQAARVRALADALETLAVSRVI